MHIQKAVITAAGKNQRTLPLQTLVDRDGVAKTVLAIVIEEALAAGVEEVGIVIAPGDQAAFAAAAGAHARRLQFIEQREPLGYGHAVACTTDFVGRQPFLLLVGDHVYVSSAPAGCAKQLVATATAHDCAVSAVQPTHESKLPYGAIGGRLAGAASGLYEVSEVLEKPTPTEAEQRLIVPGLRAGNYLCFFGMHVLTLTVMDLLNGLMANGTPEGGMHLSSALAGLAQKERYLAFEAQGHRYDVGAKYGLLTAQLALALASPDRDEVLGNLIELLAQRRR